MAKKERIQSSADLNVSTAEKVFGWKNVHKHNGDLVGKKQDKLGRWRFGQSAGLCRRSGSGSRY
jgi:hypothetical protein